MRSEIRIRAVAKQKAGLSFRLKAVQLLSLSEPDVARLIFKLEQDPLFEKLRPFIRREASKGARFFLPLKDDSHGIQSSGIDWSAYSSEIALIKKIGRARFEQYFLYGDIAFKAEEVANSTGLSLGEVRQIKGFVFAVSMQEHGSRDIQRKVVQSRHYSCIAKIELHKGKLMLSWLLPHLVRGRYIVAFAALNAFRNSDLTSEESVQLGELVKIIKFLNARQSAVTRLVELIVKAQKKFFVTGDPLSLIPLTASDASRKLKVYPSTISRVSSGRSLVTPPGSELPLEFFLPNQRAIAVNAIAKILKAWPKVTDKVLMEGLLVKHHINLSRRAVNECRRIAEKQ